MFSCVQNLELNSTIIGKYFNYEIPEGNTEFRKIGEEGYVYVSKTALNYDLETKESFYFLCRSHRFGKSLLVSILKAYFKGIG